ncbi:branched-chain amino acid transport system / permease component [mine drainage metagenome]|uniref:Branched-chain amino acid transport system / permease component n=1 Tax=mine drainage metagenome TaxID=410659 RepID=A0A1J5RGZ2_9ZZZZ
MDHLTAILISVLLAAAPLLFAALGELVAEKSGVLNLGVEGMMLVGAVCGFAVTAQSGHAALGILAAALAGMALSTLFALLTLVLLANQVATGLALTLFGVGLSALVGKPYVGTPLQKLPDLPLPLLSHLPLLGPLLFDRDPLIYLAALLTLAVGWLLARTRAGLVVRAVGENPEAAHALGYPVRLIRLACILFGGAMAGLGGAYLSLAYTPMWAEDMTAGRGWIALALVVFSTWRPGRLLLGALLFGAFTIAQLHAQALGLAVPPEFLAMLPYLATILVLVLISRDAARIRLNAPAAIGRTFHPDH